MSTKPNTILLTGARAPATLELLRLLTAAGHRVVVADSVPFALASASRHAARAYRLPAPAVHFEKFENALRQIIEKERIDLIIPTCEEIFWLAQTRLEASVFAPPLSVLALLHNKYRFNHLLQTLQLPAPHSEMLAPEGRALPFLPAVVKPVFSRFGARTRIFHAAPAGPTTWGEGMLCQELIAGSHWASYSVAVNGALRAHACYRLQWRYGATGAATFFEAEPCPPIEAQVRHLVRHLQYTGQIAFDFIERDGQFYAIECNPRLTSGIHLFRPADGLPAAFAPGDSAAVYPTGTPRKLALPLVLVGLRSRFPAGFGRDWRRATSILADWRDPLPALAQFGLLAHWVWQARQKRLSLTEVMTADIEWPVFQ